MEIFVVALTWYYMNKQIMNIHFQSLSYLFNCFYPVSFLFLPNVWVAILNSCCNSFSSVSSVQCSVIQPFSNIQLTLEQHWFELQGSIYVHVVFSKYRSFFFFDKYVLQHYIIPQWLNLWMWNLDFQLHGGVVPLPAMLFKGQLQFANRTIFGEM